MEEEGKGAGGTGDEEGEVVRDVEGCVVGSDWERRKGRKGRGEER